VTIAKFARLLMPPKSPLTDLQVRMPYCMLSRGLSAGGGKVKRRLQVSLQNIRWSKGPRWA